MEPWSGVSGLLSCGIGEALIGSHPRRSGRVLGCRPLCQTIDARRQASRRTMRCLQLVVEAAFTEPDRALDHIAQGGRLTTCSAFDQRIRYRKFSKGLFCVVCSCILMSKSQYAEANMYLKSMASIAVLVLVSGEASARTCRIVECQQVRAGEVCVSRPCPVASNLVCFNGRYTVGDGYRVFRNVSQGTCEQRCADDPNCNMLEYYYGNEGVKCNLYSNIPTVRWNSSQDALVCAWQ